MECLEDNETSFITFSQGESTGQTLEELLNNVSITGVGSRHSAGCEGTLLIQTGFTGLHQNKTKQTKSLKNVWCVTIIHGKTNFFAYKL